MRKYTIYSPVENEEKELYIENVRGDSLVRAVSTWAALTGQCVQPQRITVQTPDGECYDLWIWESLTFCLQSVEETLS